MSHLTAQRDQLLARLRRIAGQVAAIERAVEAGKDCAEILQQVAGARGALNGLLDEIIVEHLREHVAHPDLDEGARAKGADELIAVIRRYTK